jgi:hypothetical protein
VPYPTRQEADAQRPGSAGGQQVPHAVANDDTVLDGQAEGVGRRQEKVGIGLGAGHRLPGDDRHPLGHAQQRQAGPGGVLVLAPLAIARYRRS